MNVCSLQYWDVEAAPSNGLLEAYVRAMGDYSLFKTLIVRSFMSAINLLYDTLLTNCHFLNGVVAQFHAIQFMLKCVQSDEKTLIGKVFAAVFTSHRYTLPRSPLPSFLSSWKNFW